MSNINLLLIIVVALCLVCFVIGTKYDTLSAIGEKVGDKNDTIVRNKRISKTAMAGFCITFLVALVVLGMAIYVRIAKKPKLPFFLPW